jgi:hypothetical protein
MAEVKETSFAAPTKEATADVENRSSNDASQPSVTGRLSNNSTESFYGQAVADSYRLKSELVAQHLGEIGFGK